MKITSLNTSVCSIFRDACYGLFTAMLATVALIQAIACFAPASHYAGSVGTAMVLLLILTPVFGGWCCRRSYVGPMLFVLGTVFWWFIISGYVLHAKQAPEQYYNLSGFPLSDVIIRLSEQLGEGLHMIVAAIILIIAGLILMKNSDKTIPTALGVGIMTVFSILYVSIQLPSFLFQENFTEALKMLGSDSLVWVVLLGAAATAVSCCAKAKSHDGDGGNNRQSALEAAEAEPATAVPEAT